MKPVANSEAVRKELTQAYSDLRQHMKSEPYEAVVAWLENLAAGQQAHMANCNAEKLEAAQVRLKLLLGMRSALVDPGGATTGSCYD